MRLLYNIYLYFMQIILCIYVINLKFYSNLNKFTTCSIFLSDKSWLLSTGFYGLMCNQNKCWNNFFFPYYIFYHCRKFVIGLWRDVVWGLVVFCMDSFKDIKMCLVVLGIRYLYFIYFLVNNQRYVIWPYLPYSKTCLII